MSVPPQCWAVCWTDIPNTCASIFFFLGHCRWSITPLLISYSHFLLWGSINLTHCPFILSQWGKFSAKHRYRRWSLHFNSTSSFQDSHGRSGIVRASGHNSKPKFIHIFWFFFWGGVWINCDPKLLDCWQHPPPLNLTALIKLTVAIKHIPGKSVSNDTWSPQVIYVGNYTVKYYWRQQLHRFREQSGGRRAQFETQDQHFYLSLYFCTW